MPEPSDPEPDEGELEGIDIGDSVSSLQAFGSALIAGVAGFFVLTVIVTEFARMWLDFSVAAGLPAGLLGGVLIAGVVYALSSAEHPLRAQLLAGSIVGFAAGFLVIWFGVGTATDLDMRSTALLATAAGVLLAVLAAFRGRRG